MPSLEEKIKILAESARYDVSCSSSGSRRKGKKGETGAASPSGICHSWSEDGRCVSLLKLLMTNFCIYDCDYCINRRTHDIPRASFTVEEIVRLTMEFYRRNYIEGLFLSSGVVRSPDDTMEQLICVARTLRERERFRGYIHMKAIPGASPFLVQTMGRFVDRMSVNIELPTDAALARLAPEKSAASILAPMRDIREGIHANREERKTFRHAPLFVPAGQTTQMILGAGEESDYTMLRRAESLYATMQLKRVYYSAFVPVPSSKLLRGIDAAPLSREHRMYQADFLMRFYRFSAEELLSDAQPNFDPALDPKAAWALAHPELFPVEINRAPYPMLLRVPGIGPTSARRIAAARRLAPLSYDHLRSLGVICKRAVHFITVGGKFYGRARGEEAIRRTLIDGAPGVQQSLFSA